jgi:hydrogenase nickel incorporation protein HypB
MCDTCGCDQPDGAVIYSPKNKEAYTHTHHHSHDDHTHDHSHTHGHDHHHEHSHDHSRKVEVETDILKNNNLLAERNRGFFEAKNVLALNLVSSPGSGKTTLLEKTLTDLKDKLPFYIIEGDQQTANDADRIDALEVPVVQINTGSGCHLDSQMINNAVKQLNIKNDSILMIENVGNLVCPSLFDLGENFRVVIMSTTEGDDKPAKYPNMFESSQLCIINKTDLLPYLDFDIDKAKNYAKKVNPDIEFIELSARTGEGLTEWYNWINNKLMN